MSEILETVPKTANNVLLDTLTDRRIRHISAIQVRNLTPFPVRDAFASAMSQPAEQPQFTSHGHLSDDLDVTISRKRGRRISMNSIATHRSVQSDEAAGEDEKAGSESRDRRTSGSRISFSAGSLGSQSNSMGRPYSTSRAASTIRPHRARTTSIASSVNSYVTGASNPMSASLIASTSTAAQPFVTFLPDNSQTGLEKVIRSRLVETFISITIPPPTSSIEISPSSDLAGDTKSLPSKPSPSASPQKMQASSREKPSSPSNAKVSNGTTTRTRVRPSPLIPSDKLATTTSRRNSSASPKPLHSPASQQHSKSLSTSVLRPNGKAPTSPQTSRKFPTPTQPSSTPGTPDPAARSSSSPPSSHIPNYFSPIHRPSTNPYFAIDAHAKRDFAEWSDLSGHRLRIEVWGKVGDGWRKDEMSLGKGKQKETVDDDGDHVDWKVLDEWDLDMEDLVPAPEDLLANPSQLPSNTLTITLSPPGQVYYLPPPSHSITRSPTPSAGYTSDPESELRKVKQAVDPSPASTSSQPDQPVEIVALSRRRHRRRKSNAAESIGDVGKTASWQQLFNLVHLQSCIADTETSLADVVQEIDQVLAVDVTSVLRREISERETRVYELTTHRKDVLETTRQLRTEIEIRTEQLQRRREMLDLAREQQDEDAFNVSEAEDELAGERSRLLSLRSRFAPTRTTLLSTLSTIYPIELLSPPDLLYTILDIPLPIPLSSTEPAPPLSLPNHKSVTEDAVATSLGYVAQVVQLLAAYLGKGLIYPVTCIGSRSLIRDGISAMVGPRMFPLYPKGVDTYRFEYGVFLLNKDIEMLMADRDLRALDMRHTLPNLKNLLLTLTDGEGANLQRPRKMDSLMSLDSHSEATAEPDSSIDHSPSTPKASDAAELPSDSTTPPASGSSTPTPAAPEASKKTRPFLGLVPLPGFLRSHYPSSIRSSTVKEDADDDAGDVSSSVEGQDGIMEEEDDDRRTIHGIIRDADTEPEGKALNGELVELHKEDAPVREPGEKPTGHEAPVCPVAPVS